MSIKEQALRLVETLPENATWSETLERIRIAAAIDQAEAEIDAGRSVSQAEAEAYIDACLRKSSGHSAA